MLYRMFTRSGSQNKGSIKTLFGTIPLFFIAFGASAQSQSITEAMQKCSAESNSLKRLVCFDNVAKNIRNFEGVDQTITMSTAAPRPRATDSINTSPTEREKETNESVEAFGLPEPKTPQVDVTLVDGELYANVTKITEYDRNRYNFTLSNGQVWQQTSSSSMPTPKVGDKIRIKKGLFNSFALFNEGSNRKMKVKRLK